MSIQTENPVANPAAFAAMRAAIGVPAANMAASAAPTVNDDSSQGWSKGSYWEEALTGRAWTCISATNGAAVWQPITPGFNLPSGTAIQSSIVSSVNPTGLTATPGRTYVPIEICGFGTFSWEVFLTTSQAGGEMRVAVYDSDRNGLPGKRVAAPVVVDLSSGANAIKAAALGWSPNRLGRWWVMQHVKALATQVVIPRIGGSLPGIPATSALLTAGNAVQIPRYWTTTEAYGSDPVDATGLGSASVGSDCPVGWLKAA